MSWTQILNPLSAFCDAHVLLVAADDGENEERAKLVRVNTLWTNQRERYYTQNTWVL